MINNPNVNSKQVDSAKQQGEFEIKNDENDDFEPENYCNYLNQMQLLDREIEAKNKMRSTLTRSSKTTFSATKGELRSPSSDGRTSVNKVIYSVKKEELDKSI